MSGGGSPFDIEHVIYKAEVNARIGTVYRSSPELLLLDLDTPDAREQYRRVFPILAPLYKLTELHFYTSKSGKGVHAILSIGKPITEPLIRLGLQAMLGSDGVKEALSVRRLNAGQDEPSLLFRPTSQT